jgi:Tfp pilus assembly pilus retraction ATPase PilT
MSFDLLFVSEVRTPRIAAELVNASVNGKLIVSTIHSDGAVSAIARLAALASAGAGITGAESSAQVRVFRDMLASGLAAVVHMHKVAGDKREASEYLLGGQDLKARIASGEFQSLQNTVNSLKNRLTYGQPLD